MFPFSMRLKSDAKKLYLYIQTIEIWKRRLTLMKLETENTLFDLLIKSCKNTAYSL